MSSMQRVALSFLAAGGMLCGVARAQGVPASTASPAVCSINGRVTAAGDLQAAEHPIAQAPYGIVPTAVIGRGSDVVLAWTTYNPGWTPYNAGSTGMHIGMARLVP